MKNIYPIIILLASLNLPFIGSSQNEMHFNKNKIVAYRNDIRKRIISDEVDSIAIIKIGYFKNFSTISIREEEHLLMIQGNFNQLLKKIESNEQFTHKRNPNRYFKYKGDSLNNLYKYIWYSRYDSLHFEIEKYFISRRSVINNNINLSVLNTEKKEFLQLYLIYYGHQFDYRNERLKQQIINSTKQFNKDFPNSSFNYFIEKYILSQFKSRKEKD